jgi:hypothetical protein
MALFSVGDSGGAESSLGRLLWGMMLNFHYVMRVRELA